MEAICARRMAFGHGERGEREKPHQPQMVLTSKAFGEPWQRRNDDLKSHKSMEAD